MSKTLDTVVEDVYGLLDGGWQVSEENLNKFLTNLASTIKDRSKRYDKKTLRMSMLGKKDRQIWYDLNGFEGEKLTPNTVLKFLYGDIIELLLLYLVAEAGHKVHREQEEVEIEGIKGHIDTFIDEELVDVKSASTYSFKKFKQGTLEFEDPFGYMQQLSSYKQATGAERAAFLVLDKTLGHVCVFEPTKDSFDLFDPVKRAKEVKSVIQLEEPPEKCYEDIPEGASGNRTLSVQCSYCAHKFECWKDSNDGQGLRTFLYSTGPKHLTKVVKEPKVYEVPSEKRKVDR